MVVGTRLSRHGGWEVKRSKTEARSTGAKRTGGAAQQHRTTEKQAGKHRAEHRGRFSRQENEFRSKTDGRKGIQSLVQEQP